MAIGGVINTGTHPKALWPGVHAWWGQMYNEHPVEYPDLFDQLDSGMAYEQDVEVTGFGLAPYKSEGGPGTYDSEIQGWDPDIHPHRVLSRLHRDLRRDAR